MDKEPRQAFIDNGDFIVFDDGRIYKRLDPPVSSSGYKFVRIGEKSYPLHRVIASTFIPNPENKPQVNHIDGDKTNNDVSNLEWVTSSENIRHAIDHGLLKRTKKQRSTTDFAQRVKIALIERNMTQTELCNAVTERTGLYCDHSLLGRIFKGLLPGVKVKEAVCEILGIEM